MRRPTKFIIIAMCFNAMLYSCTEITTPLDSIKSKQSRIAQPSIVIIDSCEYIQFKAYYEWNITHKGNCVFCLKRNKKNIHEK